MLKTILRILGMGSKKKSKVERFLDGELPVLTARDVDPTNARLYGNYTEAMKCKEQGELTTAASLLEESCKPPSIYKGHYRELFKIYRQWNREDVEAGRYEPVVERVLKMVRYDDEMIKCMLEYWSEVNRRHLPVHHFDKDRNLKVSDAKALLKAATGLNRNDAMKIARKWTSHFERKKKSARKK